MSARPCTHAAPASCRDCDGTSRDDWDAELASRAKAKARAKAMCDPAYRAAWLKSLPAPVRALWAQPRRSTTI